MEKESKSCTGVLLRADLTGHGQFSQLADFCQKGWDGCALLGQLSKGHNVLLHYQHHISKNWRSILPCYISGLSHSVRCFDPKTLKTLKREETKQPHLFLDNKKVQKFLTFSMGTENSNSLTSRVCRRIYNSTQP